jgi:4-hydroxybenzoate polyprenyltransferase
LWALWLANEGIPSFHLLWIFIAGAVITRSAGCVINDMWDKNFDRYVTRTQHRPLTTHKISLLTTWVVLFILAFLALILALQLNALAFKFSILAALIAAVYPFMKRITFFPQIVLGVAFSMSVLIAYAATLNQLPWQSWLLFSVCILWPLMYDTAYAIVDAPDDTKLGLKSTALFFSTHSRGFIAILQILLIIGFLSIGVLEKLQMPYFIAVGLTSIFFLYQQYLLKKDKPFFAFLNNQWVGFILWLGIALGI